MLIWVIYSLFVLFYSDFVKRFYVFLISDVSRKNWFCNSVSFNLLKTERKLVVCRNMIFLVFLDVSNNKLARYTDHNTSWFDITRSFTLILKISERMMQSINVI